MGPAHSTWRRSAPSLALSLLLTATLLSTSPPAEAQGRDVVEITVVGNRADLLSGGDALVEVHLPADVDPATLQVDLDGADVSDVFAVRPDGRLRGLISGLQVGGNELTATLADGRGARITLTDHPIGGPVFSGPQIQPWACRTEENGLGPATDEQCNAPTIVEYRYMPEGGGELQPYDPDDPPDDVAMTTTDQDQTVPFIVRYERGTMNRGIYAVAVLEDPTNPMRPWDPEPHAWNHKVHWPYGSGCAVHQGQEGPLDVLRADQLADGYLIATNSLNIFGSNCSVITSAEATMMLRERIEEQFGEVRFVIGTGCSGGSIQLNVIANSYPGLVDGLLTTCTYPDSFSTGLEVGDCDILVRYVATVSPHLWANPAQQAALFDQAGPGACGAWEGTFASINDPSSTDIITGCDLPAEEVYDAETNPDGVRCTLQDYMVSQLGERPEEEWGPVEQQLGHGFANAAFDNVGTQYGLQALQQGEILPEQFVDVNEKVQSFDIDYTFAEGRRRANPATIETMYRTSGFNDFRQMAAVPIIDMRASSNTADIHTDHHSYVIRQRLDDAHGTHDNQVIWTFQATGTITEDSLQPSDSVAAAAFRVMDQWLTGIEADASDADPGEKVAANRPEEAVDACFPDREYASKTTDRAQCDALFPHFGSPRTGAGMPISHDVAQCVLAPLPEEPPSDGSYGDGPWLPGQWDRLLAAFPDGVCDYARTNPARGHSAVWLTYADGPGGERLGPDPTSTPFGAGAVALERFGGLTRIETAVLTSGRDRDQAPTVVLARADAFADAVAATPLAAVLDAPLLLTHPEELAEATAGEIARLGAGEAVVVGGEEAIGQAVVQALHDDGLTVRRVGGADRVATAAAVTSELGDIGEVFVANAASFPDAIIASTLAAITGEGLLLVEAGRVPQATLDSLTDALDVTIVGGTAAVSEPVAVHLDDAAGAVTRIEGGTRYATAAAAARESLDRGAAPDVTWIATGTDFPDALVAGAAAARDGGPLLLVDGQRSDGPPEVAELLAGLRGLVHTVRVAGGTAAISDGTASAIMAALG